MRSKDGPTVPSSEFVRGMREKTATTAEVCRGVCPQGEPDIVRTGR